MKLKKFIRFISILLALVMLAGTLTACAGGKPGTQKKPNETVADDLGNESTKANEEKSPRPHPRTARNLLKLTQMRRTLL